jgi:endo-1,4-beta-mannosidase
LNEGCWVSNPYNAKNGGPCARPADFWTNPEARRLYQKRLRYLIARWGYSPNLFAWEFWNEVPETPATAAWVAEMAAYLKRHDPNRHLVSTTYGDSATWKCPDVDFPMTHMYG